MSLRQLLLQERKEAEYSSLSSSLSAPDSRRHKGRRLRGGREGGREELPAPPALTPDSANSERSSGYHSQGNNSTPDPDDYDEANLLDVLIEEKHRFRSSFICGDATLDLFLDKKNPCNKMIHPALPGEIEKKKEENRKRGELPLSNHTDRSL